jgi:hypothetical protein
MLYKILDFITPSSLPILNFKLNKALGAIPNVNLITLKTIQFQLKVANPTSSSTFQQASTFYTKVAKLTYRNGLFDHCYPQITLIDADIDM